MGKGEALGGRTGYGSVSPGRAPRRTAGYAGSSGRNAAEAVTKYIVDMYAKAVQGIAPEDPVKWAHEQLVKIYE